MLPKLLVFVQLSSEMKHAICEHTKLASFCFGRNNDFFFRIENASEQTGESFNCDSLKSLILRGEVDETLESDVIQNKRTHIFCTTYSCSTFTAGEKEKGKIMIEIYYLV